MITHDTPEGGIAARQQAEHAINDLPEHGSHEEGNDPNIKDSDEEIIEAA